MKTLTTILMLCLPMAAMGDIYVCRAEKVALLSKENTLASEDSESLNDYVVDTERGFRFLEEGADYRGSCELMENLLVCFAEGDSIYNRLMLSLEDRTFTNISHFIDSENLGHVAKMDFGNCSEI